MTAIGHDYDCFCKECVEPLIERLQIHSSDKRNTAFSRSTMREVLEVLARRTVSEQDVPRALTDEQIDRLIVSSCHSNPIGADGHYVLTLDEVRAILTAAGAK